MKAKAIHEPEFPQVKYDGEDPDAEHFQAQVNKAAERNKRSVTFKDIPEVKDKEEETPRDGIAGGGDSSSKRRRNQGPEVTDGFTEGYIRGRSSTMIDKNMPQIPEHVHSEESFNISRN